MLGFAGLRFSDSGALGLGVGFGVLWVWGLDGLSLYRLSLFWGLWPSGNSRQQTEEEKA